MKKFAKWSNKNNRWYADGVSPNNGEGEMALWTYVLRHNFNTIERDTLKFHTFIDYNCVMISV